MNNSRTLIPPKFLQKPSPYFFMVHLLHRLYGVDAPANKMAAKTNWHRYETKLRHCHPMYSRLGINSRGSASKQCTNLHAE